MRQIAVGVVYHSSFGHTAVLAEAVAEGVRHADAIAHVIPADTITEAQWERLDACDAIVFGSATRMGNVSAEFQRFSEATAKRWLANAWQDKIAAGFANSGCKSGDKLHTLMSMSLLAAQHGMHWVNLGLKPGWNTRDACEDDLNRFGFFLGAGAQSLEDAGPDETHKSDIETCRRLGERVAATAAVFHAGRQALRAAAGAGV